LKLVASCKVPKGIDRTHKKKANEDCIDRTHKKKANTQKEGIKEDGVIHSVDVFFFAFFLKCSVRCVGRHLRCRVVRETMSIYIYEYRAIGSWMSYSTTAEFAVQHRREHCFGTLVSYDKLLINVHSTNVVVRTGASSSWAGAATE
jgi:hypothetical protein